MTLTRNLGKPDTIRSPKITVQEKTDVSKPVKTVGQEASASKANVSTKKKEPHYFTV